MKGQAWKNIKRSWTQHFSSQFTMMTVLVASFTLMILLLTISLNMKQVLTYWGESINLTVYLNDEAKEETIGTLEDKLEDLNPVSTVHFVSKDQAKKEFKRDMSSFLPKILEDEEFENPFPASFRVGLKQDFLKKKDEGELNSLAQTIGSWLGVEEISYGQEWIENYKSMIGGINKTGLLFGLTLLAGAFLVIGNSLRTAIAYRREEIEILELVGATSSMIRWPYIIEGAFTGFIAGAMALFFSGLIYLVFINIVEAHASFLALGSQLNFLSPLWMVSVLVMTTITGWFGSYLMVRSHNRGWAASQRIRT